MPESNVFRSALEAVLRERYEDPDPEFVERTKELVRIAYPGGADDDGWEDVTRKFRQAFGADVTEAKTAEPTPVIPTGEIERLVEGGWLGKYLEWTAEHEAPSQFHLASALVGVAAGLGRQPEIAWGAKVIYPNLYALLVGPTASRKTSALQRGAKLTALALETNVLPNEGTHQGFAAHLRRRWQTTGRWSDGLIVVPEFSVLMRKDRNKEALPQWFADWFDSPPTWARALRGEANYELNMVCVSMIGASNLPWLRTISEEAITGGFLPRNLIFAAEGPRHRKSNPAFHEGLEMELIGGLIRMTEKGIPEVMRFDSAMERRMEQWYMNELPQDYAKCEDEGVAMWLERKQELILKTTVVLQLLDGGPRNALMVEWFEKARRLVDWTTPGTIRVYGALGVTQEGEATHDVLSYLKRRGGTAPQSRILRALRNKYKAPRVREALRGLQSDGSISSTADVVEGTMWTIRD